LLDNCINTALYKIFHVDRDHLLLLREYLNVAMLLCCIEKRKEKFMDSQLAMPDYKLVLEISANGVCTVDLGGVFEIVFM